MTNKHLHIGVGGRNCVCCFPAPNSKERKAEYRRAKRAEQREASKLVQEDLWDMEEKEYPYERLQESRK